MAGCAESPLVHAPGLHAWERALLRDCPTSALGDVRPFPLSGTNSTAHAHAILGLKALHNFWYDMCKYAFDRAVDEDPELYVAYAFRAACDAQLIWNHEDVDGSLGWLQAAQARPSFPAAMTAREHGYFDALLALNGAPEPPTTPASVVATRPVRYTAFLANVTHLSAANPWDPTARALVPLATLAVGSVGECVRQPRSAQCMNHQRSARVAIAAARLVNPAFPGTLHYGLHAVDYPYRSVYESGLAYAIEYPRYVTSAVHSLHMR